MLHTGRRMYVKTGMKTKLGTGTTTGMMSSVTTARSMFPRSITAAPPDSILGLNAAFLADPHPTKVNLTVGAYRDAAGRPWVFPSVQAASKRLADRVGESGLEYALISGVPSFVELATDLLYGPTKAGMKDRLVSTQALSGTGPLRLGMDVLCALRCGEDQDGDNRRVYLPAQTWGNHVSVVSAARLLPLTYPYARLDEERGRRQNRVGGPQENLGTRLALDPGAMLHALDGAPRGSVVLLHASAHNPPGLDPDLGLWSQMSDIVLKRGLVPFFDVAYQGVASGSCEKDVEGLRLFVERGHTLLAAQSFAKNFGVYGERAGVLSIVTSSPSEATALRSQVQRIVRAAYSSPPHSRRAFGVRGPYSFQES
jgi:aspartate aminotransferase